MNIETYCVNYHILKYTCQKKWTFFIVGYETTTSRNKCGISYITQKVRNVAAVFKYFSNPHALYFLTCCSFETPNLDKIRFFIILNAPN